MKISESPEKKTNSYKNNDLEKDKRQIRKEKNTSLSITNIVDYNINRCWFFFSDLILSQSIVTNVATDYKLDKGKNTFIEGNEFSCYFVGISNIHYKCLESKNSYGIRKISWIISLDIGFSLRKSYSIYPITYNNKTLVKQKLELMRSENNEPMNFEETRDYYYKLQTSIIGKIVKLMDESNKFLFIHGSFISNNDLETCWKNMINFNYLSSLTSKKIGENFETNGDPEKIGTFYKCNLNNNNKIIFFKVKNIVKGKKRNKWIYNIETIGADISIIRHEIEFSLTKIGNNSCQISILIKFNENIDKNLYNYKQNELNKIINILKFQMNKRIRE